MIFCTIRRKILQDTPLFKTQTSQNFWLVLFSCAPGQTRIPSPSGDCPFRKKNLPFQADFSVPLGRLELPFLAPEANALSTELQGRVSPFYHENMAISNLHLRGGTNE